MKTSPKALRLLLDRRSLARFASAMLPAFELSPCHKLIVDHLEQLLAGKIRKLAIIAPPRHGKSLLGSVMLPAFALGRNPGETVITVSYGSELSETWGRRVRNILADPAFSELFPNCKLSPDATAAWRFETTALGEYNATGRGGPITGKGASLLILDDLIKDSAEANSEVTCRSVIDWLQNVAFTRLTPAGRVLAIATRWSERDPMGWILQQSGWHVLHLPAFAEAKDPLGRQVGEALWPSHYPVETLEAIRRDIGSRNFTALYQGNTSAASGTIFKRDWFRHFSQQPEKFSKIIQSWDTSFKSGRENDYSVCTTFGETQTGFYLLSLYRAKVDFPTLRSKVGELAELWRPSEILIEDTSSGQSLIQELKSSTSWPIVAIKPDRDKETRASAVTGYFESGRVLFPESAAWLPDLEDELASFPGGLHDDIVDSITQALNCLRGNSRNEYGWLTWMKEYAQAWLDKVGPMPPKPKVWRPQPPVIASSRPAIETFTCPACHSLCCIRLGGPDTIHCNQCSTDFTPAGEVLNKPSKEDSNHIHRWREIPGGQMRCDDCERQIWIGSAPALNGMSRAQWNARQRRFG
jgi:predicted phage terminase large subunit-like protein